MKSSGQKAASTAGLSATRFRALPSSLGFFSTRCHGAAPARAGRPQPSRAHPHLFERADNFLLLPQASRAQSMFRKPRTGFRSTASPDVLLLTRPFGLDACSHVLTAVTPKKIPKKPLWREDVHPHGACMSPGSAVQRQPQGRSQTQGVVGARGLQAARCTPGSPCPRLWSWFQVVVAFLAPHSPVSTTGAVQGAAAEPCTRCLTSSAPLEPAGRSSKGADGSHPHLSPTGTLGASSHPRKASSGAPSVDLGTRKHLPRPPPAPTLEGRARGTQGLEGRQTPGQRRPRGGQELSRR